MFSNIDVINKWFEVSGFGKDGKQINLFDGYSYEVEKGNKKIEAILNDYDSTGCLAVLFCKKLFDRVCQNQSYKVADIFGSAKEMIEKLREMNDIFQSDYVVGIENGLRTGLGELFSKLLQHKMISNGHGGSGSDFLGYLEDVINALFGLNFDLYLKGGTVGEISCMSTKIQVFPSLAQALLTAEASPDGIYICYIDGFGMEGFFTYILKSNGNILSVNDRINEAYAGSHRSSRTGRWADDKQWYLFPYSKMVKFTEAGYKGKDTTAEVLGEMNIYELPESSWMPLLFGAALIYRRFLWRDIDFPQRYLDSLQKVSIKQLEGTEHALVVQNGSALVESGQLDFNFSVGGVLKDEYGNKFSLGSVMERLGGKDAYYDKNIRGWEQCGSFHNLNQYMVDLWGDGFEFDASSLLCRNGLLLTSGADVPYQEFSGTANSMELQAYFQVRKQLADYLQKRIDDNFVAFGGVNAVKAWYISAVKKNFQKVLDLIFQNKDSEYSDGNWCVEGADLIVCKQVYDDWHPCLRGDVVLNHRPKRFNDYVCAVNGKPIKLYFAIKPQNWKGIQQIVGDIPKVVDGYVRHRKRDGNSLTDATDLVSHVHTPMETWGSFTYNPNEFNFTISVGFSKLGFNRFIKNGGKLDSLEFVDVEV